MTRAVFLESRLARTPVGSASNLIRKESVTLPVQRGNKGKPATRVQVFPLAASLGKQLDAHPRPASLLNLAF